jgi:hypothetical protein
MYCQRMTGLRQAAVSRLIRRCAAFVIRLFSKDEAFV